MDRDRLSNLVRLGTTASTVPLSIFADIPSGPVDLEESRPTMRSRTSASLHNRSGGQSEDSKLEGVSNSNGELQLQKKVFNRDAFSWLSETSAPLEDIDVGIKQSC